MGDIFFEDHYIKVGNVNTRYWLAGEKGSTVILLHGLNCHVEFWEKNIAALAQEHSVFAVDIVGFGRTDKPAIAYTFQQMADFVIDFMNAMNIDRRRHSLIRCSMLNVRCSTFKSENSSSQRHWPPEPSLNFNRTSFFFAVP